jgi:vesicle coat complex subunit
MLKDTKNHAKLKDVVRKVIAFMTLGIDVSSLFTEMSMVTFALTFQAVFR